MDVNSPEAARWSENMRLKSQGVVTFTQRIRRIRCWLRGYHIEDPAQISKFRYDVSGMCFDCGMVGTGYHEDGE